MAKRDAECTCATCGAVFYKTVRGRNSTDANGKKEWAESFFTECPACLEKERAKAAEKAHAEAQAAGLPELKGSEKQIRWAEQIRASKMESISKAEIELRDPELHKGIISKGVSEQAIQQAIDDSRAEINGQTSASWWIDNRNYGGQMLMETTLYERLEDLIAAVG